jgi:hypothetical protein
MPAEDVLGELAASERYGLTEGGSLIAGEAAVAVGSAGKVAGGAESVTELF